MESGLLLRLGNSDVRLGPRIIQLDGQIQLSDPLIAASRAPMAECMLGFVWDSRLLCSFVRDFVPYIHQEMRPNSEIRIKRARGMAFPMFGGPTSVVIVAHLPVERVRELYIRAPEESDPSTAMLGGDWKAVRQRLRTIKRQGYIMSQNEFQTGLLGVSAPILDSYDRIIGSISSVLSLAAARDIAPERMIESVRRCVAGIMAKLNADIRWAPGARRFATRPARFADWALRPAEQEVVDGVDGGAVGEPGAAAQAGPPLGGDRVQRQDQGAHAERHQSRDVLVALHLDRRAPGQAAGAGLTVTALEQAVAAPHAPALLADAGVRAIRIERPEGDCARGYDDVARGNRDVSSG